MARGRGASAALLAALVAAGCGTSTPAGGSAVRWPPHEAATHGPSGDRAATSGRPTPSAPAPRLAVVSAPGGVQPWDRPLVLTVAGGRPTGVQVTGPDGARLPGTLRGDGWQSAATRLPPKTTYTVVARLPHGPSARGAVTTSDAPRMRTVITPGDGDTVGVGQPITIQFAHPVPTALRARVADALQVQADPATTGVWRWLDDEDLHWRPTRYWAPHTTVHAALDLSGVYFGDGLWGDHRHTVDFRIGDAHVSTVDVGKHTMTVTVNGTVARVLPISAGRAQYPTHGGVHLALEKDADVIMDSATVGIPRDSPNGYYEHVAWDVRIAYSGEFVHAAPWSVADQGSVNVSHGCVNLAPAAAAWFYRLTLRGDVVDVVDGGQPPDIADPGTADWNGGAWQPAAAEAVPTPSPGAAERHALRSR